MSKPKAEGVKITGRVAKHVSRAFQIHCILSDKEPDGVLELALARFLDANGAPQVKSLLREPTAAPAR